MQEVAVIILFLVAAIYMGKKLYKRYDTGGGCASSGCDSCAPVKKEFKLPDHLKS